MLDENVVYLNGDLVPWSKAQVHMMSHSFGRGSAIFEVMSVHRTDLGPAIFRLDEHLHRLFHTADILGMECPLSYESFQEAIRLTARRNGIQQGAVKVIGFYPQISFDILPPSKMLDIAVFAFDPARAGLTQELSFEKGITACISKWRKLDPQTVPVEAKAAANYLNGMLAKREAQARGFDYAVMLDTQGFVAEGGTESIFVVKDGSLKTPATGRVLKGITRKSLLEVAGFLDLESSETRLVPEDLLHADEIFFSGTPAKVLPVRKIENRAFQEVPGPLTRRLHLVIEGIVAGREKRFREWLFPVD